jgi:Leucine-rich repeat (LRR) protein
MNIKKDKIIDFETTSYIRNDTSYRKILGVTNIKIFDTLTNSNYDGIRIIITEGGSLPDSINKFKNIKELLINGPITNISAIYNNFRNLEELVLVGSNFDNISPEIYKLQNLRLLLIIGTRIKELPKEIGRLNKLEILILDGNQELEVLPESISTLTNLIRIDCDSCKVKKLPNLEKLNKLIILDFDDNMIEELQDMFGKLESLQFVFFSGNKIKNIPKSLSTLKNLKALRFGNNLITDIPREFASSRANITV